MSKKEWGEKRTCLQCGERFYDLQKDPMVCPYCGESVSVDEYQRLQLVCGAKNKRMLKNKLHENDIVDAQDDVFEDDVAVDDELELMEDASDLSDDNHDMAAVMENMEKGEE